MSAQFTGFAYLIASVLFILALRGLSSPETARKGNIYGIVGMVIAIGTTLADPAVVSFELVVLGILIGGSIGTVVARKIEMTALPQLVAAFHSLVGLAAVFVAAAAFFNPEAYNIGVRGDIHTASIIEMSLGLVIGAITFSGSIIAFAKLQGVMSGNPITFAMQHPLNAGLGALIVVLVVVLIGAQSPEVFWALALASFAIGFLLIIPIGGADMPVVVSMLNSYSGWAACGIGFTLSNPALIVTGALVGSSGAILSYIMCKGMNRSIVNVLLGGFGGDAAAGPAASTGDKNAKAGAADDAAFLMKNASKIIIVPGYGMAVSQAQHALREMCDLLKAEGVEVKYAIHPVAGRMPGHMNVLLAEANVPYDEVFELEEINHEFSTADVAYVIGANDTTNPVAKTDPQSPIAGMPILDVDRAGTVLFVKRSLSAGYAGVDNPLFYADNTLMLFGDAKKMTEEIVQALN
ncbi:MAG: NAD(P)(+) transhydrogenase (Re/Si-specific) subunit beta [Rhodospirillaceae bacterium]|nr:NAD(P)(+) transhydrogenase (Re/Si-specific) subunit beta [Rhodospirillaceae bacterium]